MGTTVSAVKTLIIPALISLIIFLVLTFAIVPCWQRYRNRYSQYLPIETISNQTLSIRARIQGAFTGFMLPSMWRARASDRIVIAERNSFDSDDGEELGVVDETVARRIAEREGYTIDSSRRLSRDLEEGFMDDSDDEAERARGR